MQETSIGMRLMMRPDTGSYLELEGNHSRSDCLARATEGTCEMPTDCWCVAGGKTKSYCHRRQTGESGMVDGLDREEAAVEPRCCQGENLTLVEYQTRPRDSG